MNGTLSEINARLPVSANTKQLLSLCMLMFPCFSFSLESSKILRGPRLTITYKHLEDSSLLSHLRVTSGCMNVHLVFFFALRNLTDETLSIDYSIEPMLWRCTYHPNYLIGLVNIHMKENMSVYQASLARFRLTFWRPEPAVCNK